MERNSVKKLGVVATAVVIIALFLTLPDKEECWNYWNFILFLLGGLSLSGLFISIRIERVLFNPLACAISLIGTNELKAVLAPAFSTSEELEALLIFIYSFMVHTH